MDINYKKLAKQNIIINKWVTDLTNIIKSKSQHEKMKQLGLCFHSCFFTKVFFLLENSEAEKILGESFIKEKKKIGKPYAWEIENQLITQYIPGIWSRFRLRNVASKFENNFDDIYQFVLNGIRESVWKYQRPDIKFVTYCLNGMDNNIIIFHKRSTNRNVNKVFNFLSYTRPNDDSSIEESIADYRSTKINPVNFIQSLYGPAGLNEKETEAIDIYLSGHCVDLKCVFSAKKKLFKYVSSHLNELPDYEDFEVSRGFVA